MSLPESISVPPPVLDIVTRLEEQGHETWCVGGAVRDSVIGHGATVEIHSKDFDLATSATPAEVQRIFRRTVPVGVEHGTVGVIDDDNVVHEVTTFRKDVRTDGRHAVVEFGVDLHEDLARRDFTMNAIAYHPLKVRFEDPFDGVGDIGRKIIRSVGDPGLRFREDFLRILRALRFAARYGFEIESATWEAAITESAGLGRLSAERVRDEWFGGLARSSEPTEFLSMWDRVQGIGIWLPEVSIEVDPELAKRLLDRSGEMLTAYLSSDPEKTFRRLKCSNAQIKVAQLVGRFRDRDVEVNNPEDVRRLMCESGDGLDTVVALHGATASDEALEKAVDAVIERGEPVSLKELAIGGEDLLQAGFERGPRMGRVLRWLLDRVLAEPQLNTRARLLELANSYEGDK